MFRDIAQQRTRYFTLVLEDIYQAQNASAILRSAESWGIQDIHIIENTHSFHQHQRISKGAAEWLTLHRYHAEKNNSQACFERLKKLGYRIAVTALGHNSATHSQIDLSSPIAVVMGTELTGVSDTAKQYADMILEIPVWGFTQSLNVSAATAVICQRITERLRAENLPWALSDEEQLQLKTEWAQRAIRWSKYLVDMYEANEIQ